MARAAGFRRPTPAALGIMFLAGCTGLNYLPGSSSDGGSGGATTGCHPSATRCSGSDLQTCGSDGQWAAATACPTRQACAGPAGTAACTCVTDAVCSAPGTACTMTGQLATCMEDTLGCLYESSVSPCTDGACSGPAGTASCCRNACTMGQTSGASSANLLICTTATTGCTAPTVAPCSTGLVCEHLTTAQCTDPKWAAWPMPNGAGDVAAGAPNPLSFTDNGDGTLTDKVTGLMWQKGLAPTYLSYSAAQSYCPTSTLGGHADWRLPSVIELVSITDPALYKPAINTTLFTPPPSGALWSSQRSASIQTRGLLLNSDLGVPSAADFTQVFDVRCVR